MYLDIKFHRPVQPKGDDRRVIIHEGEVTMNYP